MEATLTFLGTGTSMGVPTLGCACSVCTSTDPRDRRLRPSALLRWHDASNRVERVVVIDTGPDFREQALRANVTHVDAVLYTHSHADHILGLDDLRPLSFTAFREGGPIPLYATPETTAVLESIFSYTFSPQATYPNRARVRLEPLSHKTPIHGVAFERIPLLHGEMEIVGYRFGNTAYLTDVSNNPEASFRGNLARRPRSPGHLRPPPQACHPSHRHGGAGAGLGATHRRPTLLAHPHRPREARPPSHQQHSACTAWNWHTSGLKIPVSL